MEKSADPSDNSPIQDQQTGEGVRVPSEFHTNCDVSTQTIFKLEELASLEARCLTNCKNTLKCLIVLVQNTISKVMITS